MFHADSSSQSSDSGICLWYTIRQIQASVPFGVAFSADGRQNSGSLPVRFSQKVLQKTEKLCYSMDTGCGLPTRNAHTGCTALLMQPAPLAGTATSNMLGSRAQPYHDATRTPRGDGNRLILKVLGTIITGMQPAPLAGTGLRQPPGRAAAATFLPSYAGAVTRRPLLRASIHKDGLVVHPAHLLFFQSAPGRSGHLRKQNRIYDNDRIVIHLISPPLWIPACHGCDVPFFFAVAPYSAP